MNRSITFILSNELNQTSSVDQTDGFDSHRDIENLLAERGITVSREAIRLWCIKFGVIYTRRLKRNCGRYGDTFYIDEVFVEVNGKQHYLWQAIDQDSEVVDVYLQAKRDGAAAKRFFKRLLGSHGDEPRKIVTDKLRSYGVAHRALIPESIHSTQQYESDRAEQSHEATRVRERGMCDSAFRRFKSPRQAQRVLGTHPAVHNLFTLVGTWSRLNTIETSESVRSANGIGQLLE